MLLHIVRDTPDPPLQNQTLCNSTAARRAKRLGPSRVRVILFYCAHDADRAPSCHRSASGRSIGGAWRWWRAGAASSAAEWESSGLSLRDDSSRREESARVCTAWNAAYKDDVPDCERSVCGQKLYAQDSLHNADVASIIG